MKLVVSLVAAMSMSPFGLYHHVTTDKPGDITNFALVTVRGSGDASALLKNRGNTKVFLYRRGTAVGDDDVTALQRDHPDWLARDREGRAVTSNAGGTVIDITNPAVRRWLVDALAKDVSDGGYDGVYLDVLGSFFSGRFYTARPVIDGAPLADAAWRDASVALIREVKTATGKPVIANGFGLQSGQNYAQHAADSDQLIAAADGIQIEQFVRNGNMAADKYVTPARWREDIELLQRVGRMGKIVLADTRVRNGDDAAATATQQNYALASFLVGAEGQARFRFAVGSATGTVDDSLADTINALGEPRGSARRDGGAYVRDFNGGTVRVDPVSHTASINLTGRTASAPKKSERGFDWRAAVIGVVAALAIIGLFRLLRRPRATA